MTTQPWKRKHRNQAAFSWKKRGKDRKRDFADIVYYRYKHYIIDGGGALRLRRLVETYLAKDRNSKQYWIWHDDHEDRGWISVRMDRPLFPKDAKVSKIEILVQTGTQGPQKDTV